MSIVSGYKKFKKYILTSSGFQLVSHWTNANTLQFDDGKTAQAKLGAIDGISSSKDSSSDKIAASTKLVSELNSNLQELKEGIMKIATKTVTVTTGNSGSTYQNEIDLNDMGLDVSKIVACYFEPSNAGIGLTSTGGGQCTLAKNYNTATGKLIISIGSTTYCRAMTWTGTVIAVTA